MPQNDTPQDRKGSLKPKQSIALGALATGATVREAAKRAGVARETVQRWLREDWAFQAALNAERTELRRVLRFRLQALAESAVDTVTKAVEGGDAPIALKVLSGLGLLPGCPPSIGSSNPARVEAHAKLAEQERDADIRSRETLLLLLRP
ncbi:MAG: helix-turn-helix domain-containing protein [Armatimonadetes bacterium]|nr:helix-turn-helix domain-containing protein [Armatimonadota bacterium]